MKFSAIVCAIAAASLGLGSLAQAQGFDRRDAGDDRHAEELDRRHDERHADRRDDRHAEPRFDQREERSNDRRDYYNARGPEFRRGAYIPHEYRRDVYVVDYHEHHLPPPPRDHHWVQVGADYVLVAVATGIIANIVLGH